MFATMICHNMNEFTLESRVNHFFAFLIFSLYLFLIVGAGVDTGTGSATLCAFYMLRSTKLGSMFGILVWNHPAELSAIFSFSSAFICPFRCSYRNHKV